MAPSTHKQALAALLFLYRQVLDIDLPWLQSIGHPKSPVRIPVVLSREERHAQQRSARSPLEPARIGVWRGQLTPAEAEEFATCAGQLLDELGYR